MALEPMLWAMKHAPVANVEEWAVLVAMSEAAHEDGCDSYQATGTIAVRTKLSNRTVQRRIDALLERGLITFGDQNAARHLPAGQRPAVYDIEVPFSMYRDGASVNLNRRNQGKPPLTVETRPEFGEAPVKARRADLGVPKKKRQDETEAADEVSTDVAGQDQGRLVVTPDSQSPPDSLTGVGVTTSHVRGVRESPNQPLNPPHDQPPKDSPSTSGRGGSVPARTTRRIVSEPVADTLDVAGTSPASPADRFAEFYAAYPKHTGRADAERKWRSIVKTPETAQAIIEAALVLSRHELCPKPSDARMRFVPAPAVWLNKGSWTDEYPMWRRWEDDAAEQRERAARQSGSRPANRAQGNQRDTDSFSDMFQEGAR